MKVLILFLVRFIINTTGLSQVETECEYGGMTDSGHSCTIYHVHIHNNFTKISILNADAFDYVEVDAENSEFQVFPAELFEQMPKVEEINFAGTRLQEIRDFTFVNATALKEFNADGNELTEIGENMFRGAVSLKELRLSFNQIKKISPKAFEGLINLQELNLAANRLEVIEPETITSLTNLQHLSVYENKIKFVSAKLFASNFKMRFIDLTSNILETFELEIFSPFNRISIKDNKINVIKLKASNPSAKLCIFDAQSNSISNIDIDPSLDLKDLKLTGNKIESMQNISKLSTLQILRLEKMKLKNLTGIENLTNLTQLYLSNTNVTLVPGIFSSLKKLKFLKLTNVGMSVVNMDWFDGLLKLKHLDIDKNKLQEFDFAKLDEKLPVLKNIALRFNPFNCSFFDEMEMYLNNYTKIEVFSVYYDSDVPSNEGWCIEEIAKEESNFFRNLFISVTVVGVTVAVLLAIGLIMKGFPNLSYRNIYSVRNNVNGVYTNESQ